VKRITKSEINVVDVNGVVHSGVGETLALAVRGLGAEHAADPPASTTRWTLTLDGAIIVCADRTNAYVADPSTEGAVRMERAYQLAERIAEQGGR
jgi:hypothetical protein